MSLFRLLALLFPFSQKERAPAVPFQVPEIADSDAPDLLELAQQISELTKQIANYYDQNQKPKPTFGAQSPAVPETPEYGALRAPLNDAANDLLRLVNGPKSSMRSFLCTHYDLAAYQVALECNFFEIVPKIGMALADLAKAAAMDEDRAGRIMKFLTTQRVFAEVGSNMFEHTATSMLFARDSELKAAALMQMDEMFRAASETSTCVSNAPYDSDSVNSPFKAKFGMPVWQYYQQYPLKAVRFAHAMAGVSQLDRQISELRDGFPWESLERGKVVDVGGGSGHVSISLARQFPSLNFVVQDISKDMLAQARSRDMSDLQGRVTFQQHNFFELQQAHDASAFFIRQCIHNWNDRDCIKILRAFVPALQMCKLGTPLLINDTILPEPGSKTRFEEHDLRQLDIAMLVILGAKQRTEKEFRKLLKEADERFVIVKVYSQGSMGLLEVHLNVEQE